LKKKRFSPKKPDFFGFGIDFSEKTSILHETF